MPLLRPMDIEGGGDDEEGSAAAAPRLKHNRMRTKTTFVTLGAALGGTGNYTVKVLERSIPGVDDPVYEKNRHIWEAVPRGSADVLISAAPGGAQPPSQYVCALRGLRKFGYTDATYGNRAQVTSVVAIDKENGECAHVAAFEFDKTAFWVVGSKHVHLVLRDAHYETDLQNEAYTSNPRYRVALRIAQLFRECVPFSHPGKSGFFRLLADRHLTANAEAILADSQHIVDYQGVNDLRWFALSRDAPSSSVGGLCVAPETTDQIIRQLGLHSISRSPRVPYPTSTEYQQLLDQIGRRSNSEGVVMYGSNANGDVVCLWKEKSYPYVMERIVREAIKRGLVGRELLQYTQGRLRQQKPELRKYFEDWERERLPMLVAFAAWVAEVFPMKNRDPWKISTQWLSLQREYMKLPEAQRVSLSKKYDAQKLTGVAAVNAVVLVGPPGCGKSTLARSLGIMLQKSGKKAATWLNQDELGNRAAYLAAIKRVVTEGTASHVILDKTNMEKGNRDDYQQLGLVPCLTVVFGHPEGEDAFQRLCVDRILARGNAHRSLCPAKFAQERKDPKREIDKIIGGFIARGDIDEYRDETCISVDATKSSETILAEVWDFLRATDPSLPTVESADPSVASVAAADSVATSAKYESLLRQLASTKQLYAAIKVDKAEVVSKILSKLPAAVLARKEVRPEFHLTVKYFGGVVDPLWFVEHAEHLGEVVRLHVTEVVADAKGAAAVVAVDGSFACANAIPHVTLACAPGTPPVYSNTLVSLQPGSSDGIQRFAVDEVLSGVRVFM